MFTSVGWSVKAKEPPRGFAKKMRGTMMSSLAKNPNTELEQCMTLFRHENTQTQRAFMHKYYCYRTPIRQNEQYKHEDAPATAKRLVNLQKTRPRCNNKDT